MVRDPDFGKNYDHRKQWLEGRAQRVAFRGCRCVRSSSVLVPDEPAKTGSVDLRGGRRVFDQQAVARGL